MIIPVRCFTCNNLIASKYKKYLELMRRYKTDGDNIISNEVGDISSESAEHKAFKELGIKRYCCKRCIMSHVDLIEII